MIYDVLIIGAGVTGCAIARELSKYDAQTVVIEKGEDVCSGTSKANSAIVHAGYDCKPGTMMAKMNVRGNQLMEELASQLDIPFRRNGSLVICTDEALSDGIRELYERGLQNGVENMRILNREELLEMEPNLTDHVVCALYAPTAGIICPFKLNIAMAENAADNGVDFFFNTCVEMLRKDEDGIWHVRTSNGMYKARCVVNAAGVYADQLHNQVSSNKIHITPRRGEYLLMDKTAGDFVHCTIFQQPSEKGKGVLVAPTIHGNLLMGPTATDIEDKDGTNTSAEGIRTLTEKVLDSVKNPPMREVITSFAGLRAHEDGHEFILGEPEDAAGFFDAAGIESPGLSACPAIGEYLAGLISSKLALRKKTSWSGRRKDILNPATLPEEERNELIRREPAYGTIICRCESVTEGEIIDALRRTPGARSLDGVKRRTRAGMGRCQAGFCSPRVMEIIHRELGVPMEEIRKNDIGSEIVQGRTKQQAHPSKTKGDISQYE